MGSLERTFEIIDKNPELVKGLIEGSQDSQLDNDPEVVDLHRRADEAGQPRGMLKPEQAANIEEYDTLIAGLSVDKPSIVTDFDIEQQSLLAKPFFTLEEQ